MCVLINIPVLSQWTFGTAAWCSSNIAVDKAGITNVSWPRGGGRTVLGAQTKT